MFRSYPLRPAASLLALLALLACGRPSIAGAIDDAAAKSVLLYNLMQFVEWPQGRLIDDAPLVACVFDDKVLAQRFSVLNGRHVRSHEVRVRGVASPAEVERCHVLFVPGPSTARVAELTARYKGVGILMVTEAADAASVTSTVNVSALDKRLVFDVRIDVAEDQRLTLSSKLLKLARHILGAEAPAHVGRQ